jgi:hypothetical protein
MYVCINPTGPQWLNTSIESGHRIMFLETEVLAKTQGYMDRLVIEAITTKLHPDKVNRREGFKLRRAWNPSVSL